MSFSTPVGLRENVTRTPRPTFNDDALKALRGIASGKVQIDAGVTDQRSPAAIKNHVLRRVAVHGLGVDIDTLKPGYVDVANGVLQARAQDVIKAAGAIAEKLSLGEFQSGFYPDLPALYQFAGSNRAVEAVVAGLKFSSTPYRPC